MKHLHAHLASITVALTACLTGLAQPTWTLDETVLNEYTLVSGVNIPWELTWGPDDMLWCTTREGDVLRINPASGAYDTVLELNVNENGIEPGLLGMALHPDWENSPKVFLAYTSSGSNERLSVFDWDGTGLVNEQILHTVGAAGIHNGSRLLVLPDNTLLMSTGDIADKFNTSLNPNSDNGKILRFNLDGSIPADNPSPNSHVYSSGHRNSQGLCLGPNGLVYFSEHGQERFDEFNILEANGNYGWPYVEGMCDGICDDCPGNGANEVSYCQNNNVIEPLRTWTPCAAVSDIVHYNHPSIPEWQGSVLMAVLGGFSDPVGGRLNVLHMSDDGLNLLGDEHFFSEFNQRIRDVAINPHTGAIYLAFNGPNYWSDGPNVIKEFRPASMDGIQPWQEERGLDLFPNPATSRVRFEVNDTWTNADYRIIDLSGKVMTEGTLISGSQLDVSTWSSGSYLLQTKSSIGKHMSRILLVQ